MGDAELRELEQRALATGSLEDEAALLRGQLQAGETTEGELRLRAFRGDPAARACLEEAADLDRWEPLRWLIESFYAEPFRVEDGNSAEEVRAAEERLGLELPAEIREWYRLVGRRVRFVNQDHPVPLAELRVHQGLLTLLWENQGNWDGGVRLEDLCQSSPPFKADLESVGEEPYEAAISATLQHWVLAESTLYDGQGPLGALASEVQGCGGLGGNYAEAYPRILAQEGIYGFVHGDADTLVWEGMALGLARTPAAAERLRAFQA